MAFNYCKSGKFPIEHKYWEFQSTNALGSGPYFNFSISWTRKTDHAGFQVTFEILDFMVDFKIYDNRHWDWDNNCYEDHEQN